MAIHFRKYYVLLLTDGTAEPADLWYWKTSLREFAGAIHTERRNGVARDTIPVIVTDWYLL
jgi:hypothetical protein